MLAHSLDENLFVHLENTNFPPGQIESAALNSQIFTIDVEMAALDTELARILQRRETLRLERDRCARLLSPLRRLPNEILLEIFTRVFRSVTDTGETSVYHVSQVCQAWRQLVFGTPFFWTEVVLPSSPKDQSFEALWEHLSLHVNRAQGRPISLTINALPEATFDHLIESIFASNIAHWAGISLHATKVEHIQQTLSYFRNHPSEVSHLSSLALTAKRLDIKLGEFAANNQILDFTTLSSLRAFTMAYVRFFTVRPQFDVNWAELTSLSLGAVATSKTYIKYVFNQCPNLENLTITPEDPHDDDDDDSEDDPLTLSHLRTLAITSHMHPSLILSSISAPLLEQLTLDFPSPSDPDNETARIFLSRLTGHLHMFRCTGDLAVYLFDSGYTLKAIGSITKLVVVEPFKSYEDAHFPADDYPNIFDEIHGGISQLTKLRIIEVLEHEHLRLAHLVSLIDLLRVCSVEAGAEDNHSKRKGPTLQRFVVTQEGGTPFPIEDLSRYKASGLLVTSVTPV